MVSRFAPAAFSRSTLAEEASRRALAGLPPGPVLSRLQVCTVQELLMPHSRTGCELCSVLQALCTALAQCVRRRPGWLYTIFPSGTPCPAAAPPALVQAAVLQALRPILANGGQAVLQIRPLSNSVLLCLHGGAPASAPLLWQALAKQSGGTAVFGSGMQFSAAAQLFPAAGCKMQRSPSALELLEDRFSLPYLFLSDYCAVPW